MQKELKTILPKDHPFVKKFDEYCNEPDMDMHSLVEVIEDWERGIRDWSEVREVLNNVKAE